jgi:hypothetical protein
MDATNPLTPMLAQARTWLDAQGAKTERLGPLLAVMGVVLFVAALAGAIGLANSKARELRLAQSDLAKLKQQLKDGSWSERKQQSDTLRFQLYERLWTAETAGLAEASLERWLRQRIEGFGIRPDTIRVQRSAVAAASGPGANSPLGGVQRMTAKVIMPFEPEALMQVLNAAATYEKVLVIDRLMVRGGRNALIEMDVSTFVTLPEQRR